MQLLAIAALLLSPLAVNQVWAADDVVIPAAITPPATRPVADLSRILIVSIDGCRPDVLLRADTPNIHRLMDAGCFSMWARTTPLAITLPSHTSMLTGVIPRRHEIEWNKDLPLTQPVYPTYPTLFEVAKAHGYTTAMAAGKSKFHTLAVPESLTWSFITDSEKTEDSDVTREALSIIRQHQPEVMFVHLPSTDNVGHAIGWASKDQLAAVAGADRCIGRLIDALDEAKVLDKTAIIVTADHGGAGKTHTPDDPRARHIPWIIVGPGIRHNVDLTTDYDLTINTEDTFATACYLLGLPTQAPAVNRDGKALIRKLDGKPITEVLDVELMRAAN
jgi:predicted AlkP superfamily pyrophosphatase or phosphodiesterase